MLFGVGGRGRRLDKIDAIQDPLHLRLDFEIFHVTASFFGFRLRNPCPSPIFARCGGEAVKMLFQSFARRRKSAQIAASHGAGDFAFIDHFDGKPRAEADNFSDQFGSTKHT
ncbi:MAG: hypothetical protein WDN46_24175 [Methylocella sp.]